MPNHQIRLKTKYSKQGFNKKDLNTSMATFQFIPVKSCPHLHARRGNFPKNTSFKLRLTNGKVEDVILSRTLSDDKQTIYLSYIANGKTITKQSQILSRISLQKQTGLS